jgi:hypothetical protein
MSPEPASAGQDLTNATPETALVIASGIVIASVIMIQSTPQIPNNASSAGMPLAPVLP